jgi:hypothetical protein
MQLLRPALKPASAARAKNRRLFDFDEAEQRSVKFSRRTFASLGSGDLNVVDAGNSHSHATQGIMIRFAEKSGNANLPIGSARDNAAIGSLAAPRAARSLRKTWARSTEARNTPSKHKCARSIAALLEMSGNAAGAVNLLQ